MLLQLQYLCSACCRYQRQHSSCTSAVTVLLQSLLTTSSAVTAPASVIVSAVATNVGALAVSAYTTFTSIDNQGWSSCYLKCFYCLSICRSVSHHSKVKLLLSVAVIAVATKVSVRFLDWVQTFSAATAPISLAVRAAAINVNTLAVQVLQLYCSSLCRRPPALLPLQHLLQYQQSLPTSYPTSDWAPTSIELPTVSDRAP